MRRDLREVVAGGVEEEEEEEAAEVAEAVALEVEEEAEASGEEGAVVVSEGEDIKWTVDRETSQADFCINLHDLLLWIRKLFLEQVLKNWSFYDHGTETSASCRNKCNRVGSFALKDHEKVFRCFVQRLEVCACLINGQFLFEAYLNF